MDTTTVGKDAGTATSREAPCRAIVQDRYGGPDVLELGTSAGRRPRTARC